MSEKFIVITTGGKNEDAYLVSVKVFTSKYEAEKFCKENTDEDKDEKYWKFSEIIEEDRTYEICRYENL